MYLKKVVNMILINMPKTLALFMVISTLGLGVVAAAPSVTIDPASITDLSAGDSFSVYVSVNPDGYGISSGQIDLSFDTSVLEINSLTKGNILGMDALDVGSKFDNTAGTVTAVLARMGATTRPTAADTWAIVTFNVISDAEASTTRIGIKSVGLADGAFADIKGITTNDGTVTLGAGTTVIPVQTEESEPTQESVPTSIQPEPGFEIAFAIAGLLAVSYLAHRRK